MWKEWTNAWINEFSLFYKIIGSFQDLSVLSDLLAAEGGLGFIQILLISIELCWFLWDKKIQEKYTSYKLPFNWVG